MGHLLSLRKRLLFVDDFPIGVAFEELERLPRMIQMLARGQVNRGQRWTFKASLVQLLLDVIRLIWGVIDHVLKVICWLFIDAQIASALRGHYLVLAEIDGLVRRLGTVNAGCMTSETFVLLVA